MIPNPNQKPDHQAWVRRVNDRWIAHHGLKETAAAYLDHLAATDSDRLARACRCAHLMMVHAADPAEDPKPWFYGGLFSQATAAEAKRFLTGHPFLMALTTAPGSEPGMPPALAAMSTDTEQKLRRVREAMLRLESSTT
jgi:hypothetical protein